MAKRYIDTNFFKSPFVRSLPSHLKTFYCFVICDAQGSGIWTVDTEIASVYIGSNITIDEVEKYFLMCGKAIDLKNGRWFFPDFIQHQYPSGLNRGNKAHKNFIAELDHYGLIDEDCNLLLSNNEIHEAPSKGPLRESIEESRRLKEGSLEGPTGNCNSKGKGNSNCNSKGNSNCKERTLQKISSDSKDLEKPTQVDIWPTFDDFWKAYRYNKGKKAAMSAWHKIKQPDKEKILEYLPEYVRTTHIDGTYPSRKHASTFLNQESWKDDIIEIKSGTLQRKSTAGFSDKTIEQARGWANS